MTNIKRVWIDTDTGVDDAFALITAFKLPDIEIVGISTVNGNVELEKTYKNTRDVLALCSKEDIKVYKGADRPLSVKPHYAYAFHGEDGLGGVKLEPSKAPLEKENAYDALYKKAKELNGELIIATIGPLTNLAITMFKYPDFVKYVKEIVMMGGSIAVGGNITAAAEFNIYGDPHAAQTVFKSGLPITMFGLDVTTTTCINKEQIESLKNVNNPVAKFCYEASKIPMAKNNQNGDGEVVRLHDTCPLVYLSNPEIFKGKQAGVYVETQSEISLGRTVSDLYVHSDDMFDKKNVFVILEADTKKLADIAMNSFKAY